MSSPIHTLVNTVGTSLLFPNLAGLGTQALADPALQTLAAAYAVSDWATVSRCLQALPPEARLLGAETAAIHHLTRAGLLIAKPHLIFLHSATDQGRRVAGLLGDVQRARGATIHLHELAGVQDEDPAAFAEQGLPNLAAALRTWFRSGPGPVALNATGGRKPVVAVAVAVGLAEGVPVYYQHERFETVLQIPPEIQGRR